MAQSRSRWAGITVQRYFDETPLWADETITVGVAYDAPRSCELVGRRQRENSSRVRSFS
jgi:hypothetical protein